MYGRNLIICDPLTSRGLGVRAHNTYAQSDFSQENAIVIHGGWISPRESKQLLLGTSRLAGLFPGRTVIYVEPPGIGDSDKDLQFVDAHWPFRSREMIHQGFNFCAAEEVRALHAFGVRKADLVGFSMGSNVLAKVALEAEDLIEVNRFVNVAGVLRHWKPKNLPKEFTGSKSREEHQDIRHESSDLAVREATETEGELFWQGIKDILPWWLSGSRSKAGLMIRYLRILSRSELGKDLEELIARDLEIVSFVGENDTITDAETYREFPDAQILDGLNHANLTSDPSIYVPLITKALRS